MYKHEILNDLAKCPQAYREKYSIDLFEDLIKETTEIHLGNMLEFNNMEMFKKIKEDTRNAAYNPFQGLRIPFPTTLFTGLFNGMRIAVLTTEIEKLYLEVLTLMREDNKGSEWSDSGVVRFMITGDESSCRAKLREEWDIDTRDPEAFAYKAIDKFGIDFKKAAPDVFEGVEEVARQSMISMILALHFLSCKNVKLTITPPKISGAQRIVAKSKGKQLPFEYRIITIDGIGKQKGGTLGIGTTEQRQHICRGHFAEYTENGKLFGKYTGRYWIQPHVRGNPDLGTIEKDYEVKHESPLV